MNIWPIIIIFLKYNKFTSNYFYKPFDYYFNSLSNLAIFDDLNELRNSLSNEFLLFSFYFSLFSFSIRLLKI